VIDGRHVNEEAARQSDVARNTCALLAEGFLGDLDYDLLTRLEHFGDELGTARRRRSTLMAPLRSVTVAASTPALEAATAAIGTAIATTVSTARPVEATAPAAIAATIPSAALRPLESRARIAANARGIAANEIFAWSIGVARSAGFTGKQNHILLNEGFGGFAPGGKGGIGFRFQARAEFFGGVAGIVVIGCMLRILNRVMLGLIFGVLIRFGSSNPLMMLAVGFVLGVFASALGFLMFRFFVVLLFMQAFIDVVRIIFLFIESRTTNKGIGLGTCLSFFMLGLNQTSGESGELFLVERGETVVNGLRCGFLGMICSDRSGQRFGGCGRSFFGCRSFLRRGGLHVGFGVGKHPVRQATGETATHTGAALR
jgi:hypothetical protein